MYKHDVFTSNSNAKGWRFTCEDTDIGQADPADDNEAEGHDVLRDDSFDQVGKRKR